MCGGAFEAYRPQHRFCRDNGCKNKRQRQRWDNWKNREEEKGTYRDKVNAWQQKFRQRTGYARDYELRTKYGITLEEWMAMVTEVSGRCEICGFADEALCVDHCHESGKIRGVLCRKCNRAIGQLGDTVEILEKAVSYLKKASNLG